MSDNDATMPDGEIILPELIEGTLVRRVFHTGLLISQDDAKRWAAMQPKGQVLMLGSLEGVVQKVVSGPPNDIDKQNNRDDSIYLAGQFIGRVYLSKKDFNASALYLPRYYMDRVRMTMSGTDVTALQLECELGIEATGKMISYAWTVMEFDPSGRSERLLAKHRERARLRMMSQMRQLGTLSLPGSGLKEIAS